LAAAGKGPKVQGSKGPTVPLLTSFGSGARQTSRWRPGFLRTPTAAPITSARLHRTAATNRGRPMSEHWWRRTAAASSCRQRRLLLSTMVLPARS
jgi:hypothetical protein